MTDYADLIQSLNDSADALDGQYGMADRAALMREAATALAEAGEDRERLDYLCMYASATEMDYLMDRLAYASSPETWRELIDAARGRG